jgi:hypothetical protein
MDPSPTPPTTSKKKKKKKKKKVWRAKKTSPSASPACTLLNRYGESPAHRTLNQELAWGRFSAK